MPEQKTSFRRPRWRKALIELCIFILVAANIEVFCHWRLRAEGYETSNPTATLHPRLGWRMNAFPGNRINSDGLRGQEIPAPQGGNELRILCLGGSVTYGVGVSDRFPFPVQMQKKLQEAMPDRRVVVINGGSSAMASHQYMQILVDLHDRLKPDIIIVMVGQNETAADSYLRLDPQAANGVFSAPDAIDTMRGVLYESATYRYLRWKLRSSPIEARDPGTLPSGMWYSTDIARQIDGTFYYLRSTVQNLEVLARMTREHGIHLLLAVEAHRVKTLAPLLGERNRTAYFVFDNFDKIMATENEVVGALAKSLDVPYLEMTPAVLSRGHDETEIFNDLDAVHYNPFGNGVAADVLIEEMARLGWLGPVKLDPSRRSKPSSYPVLDVLPAP